ncbi:MAG: hypothetical protein BWX89_00399 [candidate division TA06 bacterium ADurb.Bin131]|uniref:Uncharacterized protein n=1 Tax=candidate division TA06 bacterium ADurb.Bin131 TaxID=1852827 RepID=A0A1V6CCQ9_UNCT6|nr:MAG: hypothetical protein BWX89_00399 [candidate division TA06 bacterium ADurb.Bin131]
MNSILFESHARDDSVRFGEPTKTYFSSITTNFACKTEDFLFQSLIRAFLFSL